MDADALNTKIQELAKQRAQKLVEQIENAIDSALKPHMLLQPSGFAMHSVIKQIFERKIQRLDNSSQRFVYDLDKLEKYMQGQILDEVLTKLPLVQELILLQDDLANVQDNLPNN